MTAVEERPHHDTPVAVLGAALDWKVSQQALTRWVDALGPEDSVLLAKTIRRFVQITKNRHDDEIRATFEAAIEARARIGYRSWPDVADGAVVVVDQAPVKSGPTIEVTREQLEHEPDLLSVIIRAAELEQPADPKTLCKRCGAAASGDEFEASGLCQVCMWGPLDDHADDEDQQAVYAAAAESEAAAEAAEAWHV